MNEAPLGIIELLTRIGEDHMFVQNLVESATNFATKKGRPPMTAVTFLTDKITPTDVLVHRQDAYVGLVLWLPADRVAKAKREHYQEAQR